MPRTSKVGGLPTRAEQKARQERRKKLPDLPDGYLCTSCGTVFKKQANNFPGTQSPMFKANNGRLPICNECVDAMFDRYMKWYGKPEVAVKRLCQKLDIYWHPDIYASATKRQGGSLIRQYIGTTNLHMYIGRTYDDTIQDEAKGGLFGAIPASVDEHGEIVPEVSADTVRFWGEGLTPDMYRQLEDRYQRWTADVPKPLSMADEALYKQVCIQEVSINRAIITGANVEQGQKTLSSLLATLRVTPDQRQAPSEEDPELETTPLGVWARRWEEHRPIPEYEDDTGDKPGLIRYITTWFFGHVAKSLGLSNMYSQVYEDEIAKYRVSKPEFEGEDDDLVIQDIVGDGDGDT